MVRTSNHWSWLKVRLHAFCRSNILQEQFIIIIIIIIIDPNDLPSAADPVIFTSRLLKLFKRSHEASCVSPTVKSIIHFLSHPRESHRLVCFKYTEANSGSSQESQVQSHVE